MRILLFDIDGTLLITGGSGSAALQLALKDICGLRNGMEGIAPHGRTDWEILSEALQRNGAGEELSDALRSSLFSCYASLLEKEILSGQRDFRRSPGGSRVSGSPLSGTSVLVRPRHRKYRRRCKNQTRTCRSDALLFFWRLWF